MKKPVIATLGIVAVSLAVIHDLQSHAQTTPAAVGGSFTQNAAPVVLAPSAFPVVDGNVGSAANVGAGQPTRTESWRRSRHGDRSIKRRCAIDRRRFADWCCTSDRSRRLIWSRITDRCRTTDWCRSRAIARSAAARASQQRRTVHNSRSLSDESEHANCSQRRRSVFHHVTKRLVESDRTRRSGANADRDRIRRIYANHYQRHAAHTVAAPRYVQLQNASDRYVSFDIDPHATRHSATDRSRQS
jgi:hypothetical protein